jgi:hypothetical protein
VENPVMTPAVARALGAILIATIVVVSTGGLPAVGFWYTYLSLVVASIGLGVALIPVLPLIPIGRMLRRLMPGWGRRVDLALRAAVAVIPGTLYFLSEGTVVVAGARLPSDDPELGVVIVVGMVALAYTSVHVLAGRLHTPEPRPLPRLTAGPTPWAITQPEPSEEYWSPDLIEAWRVWTWNGRVLKGSFEHDWPTHRMRADCVVCAEPPGWDCPCGIYAIKDRGLLPLPRRGCVIIGKVMLSGRVVEHEDGYRASQARITEVWADDPETTWRLALAYPEVGVWLVDGSPGQVMPSRSPRPWADRIP